MSEMTMGPLLHVYCDESRQTQDRFMVFGGLVVHASAVEAFNKAMALWRDAHSMHAELKWTKVSGKKLAEYRSLVDLFFSLAGKNQLHFKSVVFDTTQIDYRTYHKGDKELGFYKFFYQFLLHCFGRYGVEYNARMIVHFDQRQTKQKLSTFCVILNRGIRKKFKCDRDVVRSVQAVDSKRCELMQVADVLMGAIGYQNNDCDRRLGARQAKIDLADYIATKANLMTLKQNTPWKMRHFGIWQFQFTQRKKKTP
ncbi:MAG: DUF3800 domain-containing protein [Pirellulaceae bacterium]|nr:DUF3800 domain-containing protein [Pirellulaceae bacterium]